VSERYNPVSGLYEVRNKLVLPTLTDDEIIAAAKLVDASEVKTTDPKDWINDQVLAMQERARILHENGLGLGNPGILIVFNEADLSIDALLEVMDSKGLLYGGKNNQASFIKSFQRRQKEIPTGGALLMDKQLQMLEGSGMPQSVMAKRITATGQKITNAIDNLTAIQLGTVPNLQLYHQSETTREGMRGKGVYTPDITASGDVAGLDDWCGIDRASVNGWDGNGFPHFGSRAAVVEKIES